MEMYQIRYFLSVARELNFTRAAEECGVAQPSLSRAIKQLEGELGGELFRRELPQAILTELGHRMLPILTRCYESAAGTLDLLKTGEVEVAISAADDLEARPWLERFPLFDEGFLVISTREHRLANSASFGLDDLREERFVLPRHAEHVRQARRHGARQGTP